MILSSTKVQTDSTVITPNVGILVSIGHLTERPCHAVLLR